MLGRGSVVYGLFFHQYICLTLSKRLTRQLANVLGDKRIKCCLHLSDQGGLILISFSEWICKDAHLHQEDFLDKVTLSTAECMSTSAYSLPVTYILSVNVVWKEPSTYFFLHVTYFVACYRKAPGKVNGNSNQQLRTWCFCISQQILQLLEWCVNLLQHLLLTI